MTTLPVFEDQLDRWGGALERWPRDARRDAEALLAASAPARALLAATREMEAALALPGLDETGFARFAAVATRQPQERPPLLRRLPPPWRRAGWGAAAAAALMLGILAGGVTHPARDDGPDQLLASALDLSAGFVDVE